MTAIAAAANDRPKDNRPDLYPVARGVEIRPRYWCEMCNQDVVLFGGKYSHAAPSELTCGLTPMPMLAAH